MRKKSSENALSAAQLCIKAAEYGQAGRKFSVTAAAIVDELPSKKSPD